MTRIGPRRAVTFSALTGTARLPSDMIRLTSHAAQTHNLNWPILVVYRRGGSTPSLNWIASTRPRETWKLLRTGETAADRTLQSWSHLESKLGPSTHRVSPTNRYELPGVDLTMTMFPAASAHCQHRNQEIRESVWERGKRLGKGLRHLKPVDGRTSSLRVGASLNW